VLSGGEPTRDAFNKTPALRQVNCFMKATPWIQMGCWGTTTIRAAKAANHLAQHRSHRAR